MVLFMKESGVKESRMASEDIFILMEIIMRGSFTKVKCMVKENCEVYQKVVVMKETD